MSSSLQVLHDGAAPVGAYFKPQQGDDGEYMQSAFRGRKLVGREMVLPEGVKGVVLRESQVLHCPESLKGEVTSFWSVDNRFEKLTVWGHDQQPLDHAADRALAWMKLSQSCHEPDASD
ncbi:unnamed protein product [Chrysoparadoxa australica]